MSAAAARLSPRQRTHFLRHKKAQCDYRTHFRSLGPRQCAGTQLAGCRCVRYAGPRLWPFRPVIRPGPNLRSRGPGAPCLATLQFDAAGWGRHPALRLPNRPGPAPSSTRPPCRKHTTPIVESSSERCRDASLRLYIVELNRLLNTDDETQRCVFTPF